MGEEQVKEASWVTQTVTGLSAYFYGISYSKEKINEEIAAMVEHIKKSGGH